ncbi:MAG: hypothetical protein KF723_22995 [Rhizobiaceae bacterium]|nr:hypothetical protein [Rhizobiaceae bacterium]
MTRTVSKTEFDAFVAANCPAHIRDEPRVEKDVEYSYDCYDNGEGEEVAFATYRTGSEPVYTIR